MKDELEQAVQGIVASLFDLGQEGDQKGQTTVAQLRIELTRPEEQFGDYATNVALQLAGSLGKNPREIAEQIAQAIQHQLSDKVAKAEVAGPGFINLTVADKYLLKNMQAQPARALEGKTVVAEYSDPNPFKVLHAGHLYTTIVGDSIARILETAGADVHRLNYGGDVGLHVGKCLWGILKELEKMDDSKGASLAKLASVEQAKRLEWLSECYVAGNEAYDNDESAKNEIIELNQKVYKIHDENDHESDLAKTYWTCREWSYEGFKKLYEQLEVIDFEKFIAESEVTRRGLELVEEGKAKGIFKESEGATVYDGEKEGLHTRVFVNSQGLPTYETKELGLAATKWEAYKFNKSIIITANDIVEYMRVVLAALNSFYPEIVERTSHLTHGMIKLPGGKKMSSRLGNILRARDVLDAASEANQKLNGKDDPTVVLGAVKYAFLKQRLGADIIYDPDESVSLEGNSGPYLQYAHARARSILRKSNDAESGVAEAGTETEHMVGKEAEIDDLTDGERTLACKISEYPEAVTEAVNNLMPHHICTYLYELAQTFNRFYENNRVIGDPRQAERLTLVKSYAETLKNGLNLLGITAPDKM